MMPLVSEYRPSTSNNVQKIFNEVDGMLNMPTQVIIIL